MSSNRKRRSKNSKMLKEILFLNAFKMRLIDFEVNEKIYNLIKNEWKYIYKII
jgi:hypothetical protein